MGAIPTDWKRRADDLGDLLIPVDGKRQPWRLLAGSDDQVVIDMTAQLDAGETLTNPTLTVWRLRTIQETADSDVSATVLNGAPTVSGAVIRQRVDDLDAGRYYLLKVLHGAAGNRRGAAMLLYCPE